MQLKYRGLVTVLVWYSYEEIFIVKLRCFVEEIEVLLCAFVAVLHSFALRVCSIRQILLEHVIVIC